ncbi:UNVERIFIED_CONTAM: noc4l-b [Trichonephila clavipes]
MFVEKILQSKKNSNCILDLEKSLLSDDEDGILSSMDTFQELFTQLYKRKMIQLSSDLDTNEEIYRLWLIERKNDLVTNLLSYLNYENEKIQEKSLEVLMTLVRLEGAHKETWNFPVELFDKIVNELLNSNINQEMNVLKFQEYMQYDDILLHSLKAVMDILNKMEESSTLLKFLSKCMCICLPMNAEYSVLYIKKSVDPKIAPFFFKKRQLRRLFSDVWERYLKFPLPLPLLKKVLLVLHKKVIPHLENPCLMTDFLTDSYSQKGVISLLSLNSLFLLMDKYNIEYPDFFVKLYSLTNAEVINGKFNLRFFYLSDLFLSSIRIIYLKSVMVFGDLTLRTRIIMRRK